VQIFPKNAFVKNLLSTTALCLYATEFYFLAELTDWQFLSVFALRLA